MAIPPDIEIINKYLNDARYRCIRDVFTEQGLQNNRPLYILVRYIMGQSSGIEPMRLCRDIDQVCTIAEQIDKIYDETSDVDMPNDIYSITTKTNNNCPSPYIPIKNKLAPYLESPDLNVQAIIKCIESLEATNLVPGFFDNVKILSKILKTFEQSNLEHIPLNNNQQLWI